MTMVPSLLRCVRHSVLVKASRNAALSGTRPQHAGSSEEANERRLASLLVDFAIVFELDPCLGRLIEELQSEVRHILEHGHQPALHLAPQVLDLTVHIGTV